MITGTGRAREPRLRRRPSACPIILEYPGYVDRPGLPSQTSFFRAADEAIQLLATNGPVYLVGESLGSGVAAYLAGTHPDKVAGVVLFAPYTRLTDVVQHHVRILPVRWLLTEPFPSEVQRRLRNGRWRWKFHRRVRRSCRGRRTCSLLRVQAR